MTADPPAGLGFKLLHVGVAVPSLGQTTEMFASLLGYKVVSGPFSDPIQKVEVVFLAKSEKDVAEIELVAPLSEDSPIQSMLKKGGGGAYHLCFETSDMEGALNHAKINGCIIVALPVPAVAYRGRRIAWIYTRSRQLVELVEAKTADKTMLREWKDPIAP